MKVIIAEEAVLSDKRDVLVRVKKEGPRDWRVVPHETSLTVLRDNHAEAMEVAQALAPLVEAVQRAERKLNKARGALITAARTNWLP